MKAILRTLGGSILAVVVLSGCGAVQASPATERFDKAITTVTAPESDGTTAMDDPLPSLSPDGVSPAESCTGGWKGWWNAIPVNGSDEGLPTQTVTVLSGTGEMIGSLDRNNQSARSPKDLGIDFQVQPDPAWPADSLVVLDVDTGKVIERLTLTEREDICDAS